MKKIQPELVVADETERCQDGDDHNDDEDDESDREDEKEVFRCLSCFSFFTPTFGGGFKLFNLFGEKAKIQTEPQTIKPVVPVPDHDNSSEQTVINITPEAALRTSEENDILKPIVYGGLTEAIVSSGIVLSAAGAGISTGIDQSVRSFHGFLRFFLFNSSTTNKYSEYRGFGIGKSDWRSCSKILRRT